MKNSFELSRRSFLSRSGKTGLAVALGSLIDIPLVMKRALADGSLGLNGKKLLFIWLRGANDALNSVIPVGDSAYHHPAVRPKGGNNIGIALDPGTDYSASGIPADFPTAGSAAGVYNFSSALRLGNGFAALHPSLKFLAPVYNAGDLAVIHRVGYPRQSRSHFDSQNYWENGAPRNDSMRDGIFYRAMVESGLAGSAPLTGVSIQSSLPLILRGSEAAMTNLSDPLRYDLLGVPNSASGNAKADAALLRALAHPTVPKNNRDLLALQHENLINTLDIFAGIDFTETGNLFRDDQVTDGDAEWADANGGDGYYLFPTESNKNGGWRRPDNSTRADKYVIPTGGHALFRRLKAAALVLNKTDAIIAGTEVSGFDTHNNQGGANGSHANLNRQIGWAVYALRKYFSRYSDRCSWDDVVVVTLTEFGRTTIMNSNNGTDHAEAGVMFTAGGGIKGYGAGNPSGVFLCHPNDSIPWIPGLGDQGGGVDGSMFGVNQRYLKRAADYRSVLGEVIRKHLGASQPQLDRILPGYADPGEHLLTGGVSAADATPIAGELGIL